MSTLIKEDPGIFLVNKALNSLSDQQVIWSSHCLLQIVDCTFLIYIKRGVGCSLQFCGVASSNRGKI